MRKVMVLAAFGLVPLLAGCGCAFPRSDPPPNCTSGTGLGRGPVCVPPSSSTTTSTTTTTTLPVVHCEALGCPGSPPDPVNGCDSGLEPVDGVCP